MVKDYYSKISKGIIFSCPKIGIFKTKLVYYYTKETNKLLTFNFIEACSESIH